MKRLLFSLIVLLFLGFHQFETPIDQEDTLSETLFALGEEEPPHYLEYDESMVKMGRALVFNQKYTSIDGKTARPISKYYSCVSCHNTKREDPNLKKVDQDARLQYAIDNKLPYLQGSTFWGIVNRETWYNDDYVLKYGDLVAPAKNSLRGSIKLCSEVCAQGRSLEEWEMNSILAYLWTLEMRIGDLGLNDDQLNQINEMKTSQSKDTLITFLKSKYLQKSPATFVDPPKDKKKGYEEEGRPALGKGIYENGCQHCHHPYGESDLVLDNARHTFKWLERNLANNDHKSVYEIVRKGTYSQLGHKEYMPHYTLEKMSNQQVEDLIAYIKSQI